MAMAQASAAGPIQSVAQELPYAMGVVVKEKKKQKTKKPAFTLWSQQQYVSLFSIPVQQNKPRYMPSPLKHIHGVAAVAQHVKDQALSLWQCGLDPQPGAAG